MAQRSLFAIRIDGYVRSAVIAMSVWLSAVIGFVSEGETMVPVVANIPQQQTLFFSTLLVVRITQATARFLLYLDVKAPCSRQR